jgi:hypothetical protein
MKYLLPTGAGLVIVLGTALAQGMWTQRWNPSPALEIASARLAGVALTVGDWQGEDVDLDSDAVAQAKLVRAWMRRYTHRQTGAGLTVLLMCGRAGPVSVHTPEWCYGGMGYEMAGAPITYRVGADGSAATAEFWTARFTKSGSAIPDHLRIFWAWNAVGNWEAPTHPRLAFGRYPVLYKLYVLRNMTSVYDPVDDDLFLDFMHQLLPELTRALWAPDEATAE